MNFPSYSAMIEYWQGQGAAWVNHSGHFMGGIWFVDEQGWGSQLVHMHINDDYQTWTTTEARFIQPFMRDYRPMVQAVHGYCLPIAEAVAIWTEKTRPFMESKLPSRRQA